MSFEKIVNAANIQNPELLQRALNTENIDVWKEGAYFFSAVSQCAFEKKFEAVEILLKRGADIDYAVNGAAIGGHKEYVETLLSRGANINDAVRGAALGGYNDYVEDLLSRGANINFAIRGAALGGHKNTVQALLMRGANINYAVFGAAMRGDNDGVEVLLSRGADINDAVRGAALGGHRNHAEALLGRGANINHAVMGAAMGGYKDYIDVLLSQSAAINDAVCGVAISGRRDYVEALLSRGAGIGAAVCGASCAGHKGYAEILLSRGANINDAVNGAVIGERKGYVEALLSRGASIKIAAKGAVTGRCFSDNIKSQIAWLSFFEPKTIVAFTKALKTLDKPVLIDKSTENRAIAVFKHTQSRKLDYPAALTITDPACQGMLYLLMILVMKASSKRPKALSSIPFELWGHIFNYIAPIPIAINSLEQLGFVSGRSYLCAQLSTYDSGWGYHKQRAFSFFKAASELKSKEELQDLVAKQTKVLQGNNPYRLLEKDSKYKFDVINSTKDRFHGIIEFWDEMQKEKTEPTTTTFSF